MRRQRGQQLLIHAALILFLCLTLTPFIFVINNSLRTNSEMYHSFFGLPRALKQMAQFTWYKAAGQSEQIQLQIIPEQRDVSISARDVAPQQMRYGQAMSHLWLELTHGYRYAWGVLRPYMVNSLVVCIATMLGVVTIASITAYVFSRYRFPGHKFLFLLILSFMMIPGILTLVPSFLWVKKLGLLNSYWVLILPYIAGGQIIAIFLFKGFFDGLPQELFESARLDGAGHFRLYWHIVLPLSKQIIAVVMIINILGAWNNFLWPFITNNDGTYHVVSSGLYIMSASQVAANRATLFASYVLASIPLLVLFVYATKPFMAGVTSGAFKA